MDRIPLISIIVLPSQNHNVSGLMKRGLEFTYSNLEVIIPSDCNVERLADKFPNIAIDIYDVRDRGDIVDNCVIASEKAHGEYISFWYEDNWSTIDYFRCLVNKAEKGTCDLLLGNLLIYSRHGKYRYDNLSHIIHFDFENDYHIGKAFFKQEGMDKSLNIISNKLVRKKLWDKTAFQLRKYKIKDEIAISALLFYFAEHIGVVKEEAVICPEYRMKNQGLTENALNVLMQFFQNAHPDKTVVSYLKKWGRRLDDIDSYKDNRFGKTYHETDKLIVEDIKRQIMSPDIKYISFDIFDTLIVRPFLYPADLFDFMETDASELLKTRDNPGFKLRRIEAQEYAHRSLVKGEEITLEEIYEHLQNIIGADKDAISQLMHKEVEWETYFCKPRKFVKSLFDFAKYIGKKIIITSDMYLSETVIEKILKKMAMKGSKSCICHLL